MRRTPPSTVSGGDPDRDGVTKIIIDPDISQDEMMLVIDTISMKPEEIAEGGGIEALIKDWFAKGIAIGTIKNRMAAIRCWARKVNKQNVVARSNEHYGIPDRRFVTNESKAKTVTQSQLDKVRGLAVSFHEYFNYTQQASALGCWYF